ncbi:MAG TPA: hypothetical protein VES36_03230 [Candidatus Limnocylindrales bacterium]|nr:hypothetical protein [Candidatus Limnocylindrales bacterium]
MRSILALLGGIAISVIGLAIVLGTAWELPGVALIVAGVAFAAKGMSTDSADVLPRAAGGRSSIVRWPSGLGHRLARGGSARRKAD